MEHLLLMLGTGPSSPEQVKRREYRQATYFLRDDPERGEETTPFVGEAILRLHPERFGRVHLFGTTASMWETLYWHALPGDASDEHVRRFDALVEAVGTDRLAQQRDLLRWVEQRFREHTGVETACHLLPPGRSEDEFWAMLRAMADLDIRDGTVSLDVTHGLRAQPLFLLLALFYLRSVHPEVTMGSVFYGALELARDHFDGRAPIFDLRPMVELMDWIEAARVFDRYEDAAPLAALLRATSERAARGDPEKLARRAETVSQMLQVNAFSGLRSAMQTFRNELDGVEGLPLLDLIRPRLERLPETLLSTSSAPSRALLELARRHWSHYQAALAVLTAWEAVVARMAQVYDRSDANEADVHSALGYAAGDRHDMLIKRIYRPAGMTDFPDHVRTLRNFRNTIAHSDRSAQRVSPRQVYAEFPDLLAYLETHLHDDALERLPEYHRLSLDE
jgi:CRISPR-associated Csx2 family protein